MDSNEAALAEFIKTRILKSGGLVQVKYLCQLLPSLNYEIRNSVASNQIELMKYLRKYSNVFLVEDGAVKFPPSNSTQFVKEKNKKNTTSDTDSISSDQSSKLPEKIFDGEGVVIKIHPTYGFITSKNPFKTTIYFTPACFNTNKTLLTDFDDLTQGSKVCFNAKLTKDDKSFSKYRATKVWFNKPKASEENYNKNFEVRKGKNKEEKPNKSSENSQPIPNSRKSRETGLYDAISHEGEGNILKLFSSYGFIAIDNDKNNVVYFYKSNICNYDNVLDLTKLLNIGDLVEFKAVRAPQKNSKARWSATQVWVRKSEKSKYQQSSIKSVHENTKNNPKYIKNESGKIYPHASGTVIKFGKNYNELADADASLFYMLGIKIVDVSWEFSDGDNVYFDAVKINSHPGWKASLVWTGKRPEVVLPPDLGDFGEYLDDVESIPDSASCISKSSDNSVRSQSNLPKSKSSGYSSLKSSRENIYNSKQNSTKDKISYLDDVDDLSDSTNSTNYYPKSANMSDSNRQSKHFKPQNRKKKFVDKGFARDKSATRDKHSQFKNFKQSRLNSPSEHLDIINSIKSERSGEELIFLGSPKQSQKTYTSWGDSPYPDDDENFESKEVKDESSVKSYSPEPSKRRTFLTDSITDDEKEIYNSEDEYGDTNEDFQDTEPVETAKQLNHSKNNHTSDIEAKNSSEKTAKLTRFYDIEGLVTKVYCKFVNMENSTLSSSVSLFWNDLYLNGIPVSNSGIEDLREIVKEGHNIKFNCLQIITDDESCFIKVTAAWLDHKPNIVEITPDDYMSQIGLSAVLIEDKNPIKTEDTSAEKDDDIQEPIDDQDIIPVQKFLATISDSEEEDDDDEDLMLDTNVSNDSEMSSLKGELVNSPEISPDKQVINGISEIIRRNVLPSPNQVDVDSVSSQILEYINSTLYRQSVQQSPVRTATTDSETVQHINETSSSSSNIKTEKNKLKNTESQTIFTGEVIGKDIFIH